MTSFLRGFTLITALLLVGACSPKYDWREIHASHAPYVVAFPAKPNNETRDTRLAGQTVSMTMSSTQVDGVTFAVASATMPDAAQAQAALPLLKAALVGNIGGQVKLESAPRVNRGVALQIEASGSQTQHGTPQAIVVHARFIADNKQVYQLVVMGPSKRILRESIDTFFTSFKSE